MTGDKDFSDSEKKIGGLSEPESLDLKALREGRGLSLRDIYKQTRVSVVNLEAIETEQFHLLPSPAYAKTFIKAYAEAIGMDVNILLIAYSRYLQSKNIVQDLEKDRRKATRKNRKRFRLFIGCVVLVVLVVGFLLAMSLHHQINLDILRDDAPQADGQKADEKIVGSVNPAAPPVVTEQAEQANPEIKVQDGQIMTSPAPPLPSREMHRGAVAPTPDGGARAIPSERGQTAEPEKAYRLLIEAREVTWIRIKADHQQSSQIILQPGQKIERFASERFVVDVGNAAGIDLSFQGMSMGSLGEAGQVVHLTLPKERSH